MDEQELGAHFEQMRSILSQKPNERCPTCNCCDIGPYVGPNNPGGYCCGAYVSGGQCHLVVDAEFGSSPSTMEEWRTRADEIRRRSE